MATGTSWFQNSVGKMGKQYCGLKYQFMNKLCSMQLLSRSLWKKVCRHEKRTPTLLQALLTAVGYAHSSDFSNTVFQAISDHTRKDWIWHG